MKRVGTCEEDTEGTILCRTLIMKRVGTCEEDTEGTSHAVSYFDNEKGRDV